MEVTDKNLNSVINLLHRHREIENDDYVHRENLSRIEVNDKRRELKNLHDQQVHIKENISKNLKSIVTQKHGLQKIIQGSECNTSKLPVTHKYQQEAINLISDAINFVNNYPEICESIEPKNDIDIHKLCCEIWLGWTCQTFPRVRGIVARNSRGAMSIFDDLLETTRKNINDSTTCVESVNQELNRSKTRFDQVETFRENTEIIKNHCFLPCDDDPNLIE